MTTLAEFLLARIAEDEAVARDVDLDARARILDEVTSQEYETWRFLLEQSPARVLAECEAKRRIVETWRMRQGMAFADAYPGQSAEARAFTDGLAEAMQYHAQPYADHPDFDPEWAS